MALNLAYQQELELIAKGDVRFNESLREHTTIKIGGPADIWFEPTDVEDLLTIVKWADALQMPRTVFGNGSNTLVRDGGIRGLVISLVKFDWIESLAPSPVPSPQPARQSGSGGRGEGWGEGCSLTTSDQQLTTLAVGAGVSLPRLLGWAAENSISGLEHLTGVPGSVGGAVQMNAGTKNGTISDVIKAIKILNKNKIVEYAKKDLEFSYRKLKLPKGAIIVEAGLELKTGVKHDIEGKMDGIRRKRKEIQPLIWPSLGSVFKNPSTGPKAWQLIDNCSLRGVRVGGARVANEHANWIINEGNATAKDVEVLIKMIREKVKDESDILLETEIVVVGE